MIDANPGTRPSRLSLDCLAAGELSEADATALRARLDEGGRAHLAAVEAARAALPSLDVAALRQRAARLPPDAVAPPAASPRAANGFRAFVLLLAIAAVALVGFATLRAAPEAERGGGDVRFRTGDGLEVVSFVGSTTPRAYVPGTPVGPGSVLGFRVVATGHTSVVLLSVDGLGETTVFWPERGDAAEPIRGDGFVGLPGTVILDDAPGPEVFVAVYDRSVPEALALVKQAWATGGAEAVEGMAERESGVHAVEVTRP